MRNACLTLVAILLATIPMTLSCGHMSNRSRNIGEGNADDTVMCDIKSFIASPDSFVNKEVIITGRCVHVCPHGKRRAFLAADTDSFLLTCESTTYLGGAFPKSIEGHTVTMTGILKEVRIDENTIGKIIENHAARTAVLRRYNVLFDTVTTPPCPYAKITRNQRDIHSLEEQIENYRARINYRYSIVKKNYISIYHLQVSDLKLLD